MKHLLVLACLLSANIQLLPAQDSLSQKPVFRIAKIKTLNAQTSTGYLYAITDSALLLSIQKEPIRFYDNSNTGIQSFQYKDLEKAEIYKKGQLWRSPLTGLLIGMTIGAVIGYAGGDDPKDQFLSYTAGEKAVGLGIFGGAVGGVTGLIIGLCAHKTFQIHGKKENYEKMRKKMMAKLGI